MSEHADAQMRRRPLGVHADPYFVYTLGDVIDKPPRWAPGTLPPREVSVPDELAVRYSRLMGEFWALQRELRALFDHAPSGGEVRSSRSATEHTSHR